MDKLSYKKLVKRISPKEPKIRNAFIAFLVGGTLGMFCEVCAYFIVSSFGISKVDAYMWVCMGLILVSCFLTSLGKFDNIVSKVKCGLIIPTTGFAHSVCSCALDYKKDGLVTGLGSNFFKLAGAVILFGILSGFFLVVLEVLIHG